MENTQISEEHGYWTRDFVFFFLNPEILPIVPTNAYHLLDYWAQNIWMLFWYYDKNISSVLSR